MKTDPGSEFAGFSEDAMAFYRELAANNTKEWFDTNRERYERSILVPAEGFVGALGMRLRALMPEITYDAQRRNGAGSIFRIQKDVRFSRDKSPYKTNLGMLFWVDQDRSKRLCPHFYVGVYPEGGLVHAGLRGMPSSLLRRYREAVAAPEEGEALRRIMDEFAEDPGLKVGSESLKRVPRGYDPDHPRAALLRHDGVFVETGYMDPGVVSSPDFVEACFQVCRKAAPLVRWLAGALGTGG